MRDLEFHPPIPPSHLPGDQSQATVLVMTGNVEDTEETTSDSGHVVMLSFIKCKVKGQLNIQFIDRESWWGHAAADQTAAFLSHHTISKPQIKF